MKPIPVVRKEKGIADINFLDRIYQILSGNISFGNIGNGGNVQTGINPALDNIKGTLVSGITPAANTQFTIKHSLGYVPIGWLVIYKAAACDFYDSIVGWDKTNIYLKATTNAVQYTLLVLG